MNGRLDGVPIAIAIMKCYDVGNMFHVSMKCWDVKKVQRK